MKKKLLVTTFEPFAGLTVNPTGPVAHGACLRLAKMVPEADPVIYNLPVSYAESSRCLEKELSRVRPDAVVATGVAVGRRRVSLEKIAVNLNEASIPDNSGVIARNRSIEPDGPATYVSSLPLENIVGRAQKENLAIDISYSAGTYVCNHVFYRLMHLLAEQNIPAGFVHIPAVDLQTDEAPEYGSFRPGSLAETGGRETADIPRLDMETACKALALILAETIG